MISRTLLSDLLRLCDRELAPAETWLPRHSPQVDVDGVVECRARLLEMLAESEAA